MKKILLPLLIVPAIYLSVKSQTFPDEMHVSADGHMILIGDLPNQGLYDQTQIKSIYLSFSQPDFWQQLDNNYWAWNDAEIPATMVVDGITYDSVGVRFRGQSSFQDPLVQSSDKKPFGISLDFVHPLQDIQGRKSLNLNNSFEDPSFISEIFYQHQIKKHIPVAKSAYVQLYINGMSWGLYTNVQQLNKSFYKDWYLSAKGTSWRADRISGAVGPYGDGTGGMNYLGGDSTPYKEQYIMKFSAKANPWDDLVSTCDVLNNTPLSSLPLVLPAKLDIDRTLWFLGSELLFSDDDSYIQKGRMDYCIYWESETGRIAPQEYDGNTVMNPAYQFWDAFYHADNVNYPLLNRLLAVPEYRQRYLAHLRTLINEEFGFSANAIVDGYAAQINAMVQSDTKKLYSYADFQDKISSLKSFIITRRNFLSSNAEVATVAPVISNVGWYVGGNPWSTPAIGQSSTVRASATCGSGIYQMNMYYSNTLVGNFTKVQMLDDGLNDDEAAGDGIYGAAIPGQSIPNWMRFYVEAVADNPSKSVAYEPAGAEHNVYAYMMAGAGVRDVSEPETIISLFPNPAGTIVEIEVAGNKEDELIILNSTGQQIHKEKFIQKLNFNVHNLPSGLYFVRYGGCNKKLVVQH